MSEVEFVVVWALAAEQEEDCWIMVKNRNRGWELPGGRILDNESPDEAALRELYEEAGILGTAKAIEFSLIDNGCVVLVHVDGMVDPEPWFSHDDSIEEVGWCLQIPEGTAWDPNELAMIKNHDWSSAMSLVS